MKVSTVLLSAAVAYATAAPAADAEPCYTCEYEVKTLTKTLADCHTCEEYDVVTVTKTAAPVTATSSTKKSSTACVSTITAAPVTVHVTEVCAPVYVTDTLTAFKYCHAETAAIYTVIDEDCGTTTAILSPSEAYKCDYTKSTATYPCPTYTEWVVDDHTYCYTPTATDDLCVVTQVTVYEPDSEYWVCAETVPATKTACEVCEGGYTVVPTGAAFALSVDVDIAVGVDVYVAISAASVTAAPVTSATGGVLPTGTGNATGTATETTTPGGGGGGPIPAPTPTEWVGVLSNLLAAHNSARAEYDANPLTWNSAIAADAQAWADTCRWEHPSTAPYNAYGQNLAFGHTTAEDIVGAWMSESSMYTGTLSPETGHFTQVVWKSTTELGCGMASCPELSNSYCVCFYSPPGNYVGEEAANVQWPKP
ncbi:hypothetical protein CANCADRAFT_32973 [Tortispora caseinolytica NRRL Y-17796]|uniref:SCP domain-containing protein n=1 Tax=Tortispora caseinolytica NRRL Y-17796 TaxID=767744 RepID=A0A1E4T9B8_9ASCO|nr:hypothetical protein CANCADRAFT_32973 [Tortispora caseinolytica NRRL Y-17796]